MIPPYTVHILCYKTSLNSEKNLEKHSNIMNTYLSVQGCETKGGKTAGKAGKRRETREKPVIPNGTEKSEVHRTEVICI